MVTCRMALRDSNLRTDPSFRHSRKTLRSAHCDQGVQSTPPPVRKVNSICTPALHSQGGPMYDGSCHRPAESRRGEEPAGSFRPLVQSLDSEEQQNSATWSIYTFVRPPRLPDGDAYHASPRSSPLVHPSSSSILRQRTSRKASVDRSLFQPSLRPRAIPVGILYLLHLNSVSDRTTANYRGT